MGRKPKEPPNPDSGRRLKSLMVEKKIKNEDVAEALGYNDPKYVSLILTGKRRLQPNKAQKFLDTFLPGEGNRINWLLGLDDFRTEAEKDAHSKKDWEESTKAAAEYESKIRDVIEELVYRCSGYELLPVVESHALYGECVGICDEKGEKIGLIELEKIDALQQEAEHYISYLADQLIKNDVLTLPKQTKGGGTSNG